MLPPEDKIMVLSNWKIRLPPCHLKVTGKKVTLLAGITDPNY